MELSGGNMQASNTKPFVFDGKYLIPQEIVDDVICRFLLNIPKEEKFDPIRVCFQIELAHWFFVDYYCGDGCAPTLAHLRSMPYNQFAYIMFQKTPHLRPRLPEIEKHLSAFREYKMRVPTFGAILMNQSLTKVVLVQGFRNHWGFPKGKVNEMEDPVACAIREVFEETGYDIAPLVNENQFIESKILERNDRLYLIRGVEPKFQFQPQTQFEIKNIQWFNINELPEHKKDPNPAIANHGVPVNNFYSVYPYIRRLKLWVADKLDGRNKIQNYKVRPDDNAENQMSMSANLQKSKSSDYVQKQGKTLMPFQFHFPDQQLSSGDRNNVSLLGGWKLFPSASDSNHPYVLNSNAIQELILGQSQSHHQQPQQQRQGGNAKGNTKGVRRRLFSEESLASGQVGAVGNKQHSKIGAVVTNQRSGNVGGTPQAPDSARTSRNSRGSTQPAQQNQQTKPKGAPKNGVTPSTTAKTPSFRAPAWTNFSFDRERIYKAFFMPPSQAIQS